MNLALGSALASIGLTIPAVAVLSIVNGWPLVLGIDAKSIVLLVLSLFVAQITLLLAHLPHWDKFDLCGMSLGGPIASHFAHYYPQRVDRLILLCPAGGTPHSDLRPAVKLIRSHLLPNSLLRRLLRFVPLLPTPPKGSLAWWQAEYHPGYKFSFASSLQDGPIFNAQEVHRAVVRDFGSRLRVI